MRPTLDKTGDVMVVQADTLTIMVKRQDEGVSVYIAGQDGECITETWATFSEGVSTDED